jgi:hypothetical protein
VGPNFSSVQQYRDARLREMRDTGVDISTVQTIESLRSKAAEFYAKIIKDMASW